MVKEDESEKEEMLDEDDADFTGDEEALGEEDW